MAYTTIDDPSAHFQTITYTGNGASRSITNTGNSDLKPDWVWIKERNNAVSYRIFDSSRGAGKRLFTNSDSAESTHTPAVTSFDSDGFSLGDGTSVNENSDTYVAWQWAANGGTTSSDSNGSITSTVQANTTAGFSILTWAGNGTASQELGHGLGVTPKIMIQKNRSQSEGWQIFGSTLFDRLQFDTGAEDANLPCTFSSTTITLPNLSNNNGFNSSGDNFVSYVFAEIKGYSKFGIYTGNGTGSFGPFANGTFVYTGFKVAWLMIKRLDGTNGWTIFDSVRDPHNVVGNQLSANSNSAEEADASHHSERDYYSNGFKLAGA